MDTLVTVKQISGIRWCLVDAAASILNASQPRCPTACP